MPDAPNPLQSLTSLTVANARAALAQGNALIGAGQSVLDLSNLTVVDSAAVAVLLAWQRSAHAAGTTLTFANLPANLNSLVHLYGVDTLLIDPALPGADTPVDTDLHHH